MSSKGPPIRGDLAVSGSPSLRIAGHGPIEVAIQGDEDNGIQMSARKAERLTGADASNQFFRRDGNDM
jgi:hypothetical protein